MKKFTAIILCFIMILGLAACGGNGASHSDNVLIVYFSWSGNSESVANYLKNATDGYIFVIESLNAYPTDYDECIKVADKEKANNSRPEIKNPLESIEGYDTILICYPIWRGTAPMIIGTFLESYDLTGVNIYPFSQSASMDESQFNESVKFIKSCASGANVCNGLFAAADDTDAIDTFLSENGIV